MPAAGAGRQAGGVRPWRCRKQEPYLIQPDPQNGGGAAGGGRAAAGGAVRSTWPGRGSGAAYGEGGGGGAMVDERTSGPEGGLPGPRRGRAVDADLRGQAVAAVVRHGMGVRAAARHFGLGEKSVQRWVKQFRERRPCAARKAGRQPLADRARAGADLPHPGGAAGAFHIRVARRAGRRGAGVQRGDGPALPETPPPGAQTPPRPPAAQAGERPRRRASDANPATPAGSIPSRSRHRGAGVRRDSP